MFLNLTGNNWSTNRSEKILTEPILFKKYANRRLYNLRESKYMTLDDVSGLIVEGHDVKVVDAKTKEDVTSFILAQIILEQAKNKNILLPSPLLHLVIRNSLMPQYLENNFKQLLQSFNVFMK